jgi:hypothetical protein
MQHGAKHNAGPTPADELDSVVKLGTKIFVMAWGHL